MHSKAKQSEADGKAMLRDAWRADRQGETPLCDTI